MAALAFVAGSTVLPVFLSKLTSSKALIGLISHIEWFGWLFPQLFAATLLVHRKKALGFYNRLSLVRLLLLAFTIGAIFAFHDNRSAILVVFAGGFTVFSLTSGFAGVAFMEVVGKAIPTNKRGSFFGWRMFTGGLLAALAGIAVKYIMATYPFPFDFGYVCAVAWVLMMLGLLMFAMIKEPENDNPLERSPFTEYLKKAYGILRSDSNLSRLIFSKAWVNTALMAMPFYVLFAIERLGAKEWMAGIYLTVQMAGYLMSNLLWGWLSNRISNRLVILFAGVFRSLSPLITLIACFIEFDPYMFSAVFLFIGVSEAGVDMGYMNYLLEIAPGRGRPLYVGLMHTLIAPTVLFAGIGGLLSDLISMEGLFTTVFVTVIISFMVSFRLKEPRSKSA